MALIGKIRQRSGLLIAVIGIAMLAFIIGDLFKPGGGVPEFRVGEVYGEEIDKRVFDRRVSRQVNALQSTGQQLSAQDMKQIENEVWNQMIREIVLGREFKKLGIDITKDEYDDIRFGENILPEFRQDQTFINPETGRFDTDRLREYFFMIQERYPEFWSVQKERIVESRKSRKYTNLVKGGVYANSIQAQRDHVAENKKADFKFVLKRFNNIPDSLITYSESDVQAYYNKVKNESRFEQEDSRSIEYIVFDVKPSERDLANHMDRMQVIAERFQEAKNDTLFFTSNTNQPFRPVDYVAGSLEPRFDTLITKGQVGDVIGPYQDGEQFKVSKIIESGKVPEVNARHILLKAEGEETSADVMKRAEDLKKQIKRGGDFAELAKEKSEDFGSAQRGGDLDWFGEGRMVAEFNDACFQGKVGDMPIVETQFGVHLIEILDRRETEQLKIVTVSRDIRPSKESFDKVYDTASSFSINYSTPESFLAAVEEQGLRKRTADDIKESDMNVRGIQESRKLVRWVFDADLNEVSQPIELDKQYVVALVTKVKKGGVPRLDDIRETLMVEFMKKKKAELYAGKMSGTDLNQIASAIGEQVQTANDVAFSNSAIPGGGGNEPKIIGTLFTLESGQVSVPLEGNIGVYVVELISKTDVSPLENYADNKEKLSTNLRSRVDFEVYKALEKKANVKDERARFF
jgi:peptidyl-prolyl cis-trans isomerase D